MAKFLSLRAMRTSMVATAIAIVMSATGCSAFIAAAPGSLLGRVVAAEGVTSSSACHRRPLGKIGLGDGLKARARPVSQAAGGLLAARASAVDVWSFTGMEAPGIYRAGSGMAVRIPQGPNESMSSLSTTSSSFSEASSFISTVLPSMFQWCLLVLPQLPWAAHKCL